MTTTGKVLALFGAALLAVSSFVYWAGERYAARDAETAEATAEIQQIVGQKTVIATA